jgi:hypothetical protein
MNVAIADSISSAAPSEYLARNWDARIGSALSTVPKKLKVIASVVDLMGGRGTGVERIANGG